MSLSSSTLLESLSASSCDVRQRPVGLADQNQVITPEGSQLRVSHACFWPDTLSRSGSDSQGLRYLVFSNYLLSEHTETNPLASCDGQPAPNRSAPYMHNTIVLESPEPP